MVAIPEDVVRCRLVFSLGTGRSQPEQAILGFHLHRAHSAGVPVDWPADTQTIAEKVRDKWITRVGNSALFPGDTKGVVSEAYHLNAANGHALDKGASPFDSGHAWSGFGGDSLPFETSCAVSLYGYTPGTFGVDQRTQRGRFYLPPFATTAMGTGNEAGLFSALKIGQVSDLMTAFLNDVQGMHVPDVGTGLYDPMNLVILSRTKGAIHQVERIRVGHVPDSQRRRRRSQAETYVDTVLAHS